MTSSRRRAIPGRVREAPPPPASAAAAAAGRRSDPSGAAGPAGRQLPPRPAPPRRAGPVTVSVCFVGAPQIS